MGKILIIGDKSASLLNFRGDLIRGLLNSGHEVLCIACDREVENKINSLGARLESIPLDRLGINPVKDFVTFFSILEILRKERPDALLLYTFKPVIYGSIAASFYKKCKTHSFITGLGSIFSGDSMKCNCLKVILALLLWFSLSGNEKVFFLNPDDAGVFSRLSIVRRRQAVLINGEGVNLAKYSIAPLPEGKVSFVLISRLIRDKGIMEFSDAARILKSRYPEVSFKLVGPYDDNLAVMPRGFVESLVDEGIIEYFGEVEDVRPIIAESSILVLPSYYGEGTPRSILEGMAMGRPIITCDSPGCRETVIEKENGFLIPVRNSGILADRMEEFISNPDIIPKMGEASRRIAEERYDVNKVNKVIIGHLRGVNG